MDFLGVSIRSPVTNLKALAKNTSAHEETAWVAWLQHLGRTSHPKRIASASRQVSADVTGALARPEWDPSEQVVKAFLTPPNHTLPPSRVKPDYIEKLNS